MVGAHSLPAGYVVIEQRSLLQWLPGTLAVVVPPLVGLGVDATTKLDSTWIPVAGPWLAIDELQRYDDDPTGAEPRPRPVGDVLLRLSTMAALGFDGVVQGVGWGWLIYGCMLTEPKYRYLERKEGERALLVPGRLPDGGWNLQWVGTF